MGSNIKSMSINISREKLQPQESSFVKKVWIKCKECTGALSFRHFLYNENPTKPLNTTSVKCCLPSTDVIDRQEKIHAC